MDEKKKFSREEAEKMLFGESNTILKSKENIIFDTFGNYVFSTDIVINEPNIAYGSIDGFSFVANYK